MVRLLAYANEFDIELILTSSAGVPGEVKKPTTRPDLVLQIVDAYEAVLPNLRKHAANWPEPNQLRGTVKIGNPLRGMKCIGEGHDTEGSYALIKQVDAGTPDRPLNVTIWGGQTDLAQALWRVRKDRSEAEFAEFVTRMRVFDINDQDRIANWMRDEFPGMNYILAKALPNRDKREGIYRGMYLTGDESLTSHEWIAANVLSSGPLGALYPTKTWTAPNPHGCMKEGDTPSWFFFLTLGGNNPADPSKPGWGGQYEMAKDGWYTAVSPADGGDPRASVSRWRPEFQANFARRMAWCRE